jgi:heme-degrading monooxygenase HmoA
MNAMKKTGLLAGILFLACTEIYAQTNESKSKSIAMQQILIDKFIVPDKAKEEFLDRLNISLELLSTIPGLIETTAYEQTGGGGEFNYVTTAVWENKEALENARNTVKAEYEKEGFNPQEMFERLNIEVDRAVYKQKKLFRILGKRIRKQYVGFTRIA